MQVIRSLSISGIDFCVSAAYNWHYVLAGCRQIAAQPTHLDPEPNRKKSKQRYASSATGLPAIKKQGQDKRR